MFFILDRRPSLWHSIAGDPNVLRFVLRSKVHRATVTRTELNYEGSLTLDPVLMQAGEIFPGEQVQVLCLETGHRFETYVIEGERGSGEVCVNGPAARLVQPGDRVILMVYGLLTEGEQWKWKVVHVDDRNRVTRVERHGLEKVGSGV